jgi:hypothetical protein
LVDSELKAIIEIEGEMIAEGQGKSKYRTISTTDRSAFDGVPFSPGSWQLVAKVK